MVQHLIAPQLEIHDFPIKIEELVVRPLAHSKIRMTHDVPHLLLHVGLTSAVTLDIRESGIVGLVSGEVIHMVRRLWLQYPSMEHLRRHVSCVGHAHLLLWLTCGGR